MNSKLSNLLTNDSPAPVLLSNGILLHNKIDLDALGLSSYKKHFNAKEFSKLKESTEPSQPPSSALKKLTQPTESYDSSDPSEISASLDQTVSSEPNDSSELSDSKTSAKPIESTQISIPLESKEPEQLNLKGTESSEQKETEKLELKETEPLESKETEPLVPKEASELTELIETKIISPAPQISKPFGGSEENSVNTFFDFHKADAPKDFSWMATLWNYDGGLCGGILLDEYWVLTAYHCLEEVIGVKVGEQFREVEEIIRPESDNEDLMLLRLKTPVDLKNINLIKMASKEQNFNEGTIGFVSGWGDPQHRGTEVNEGKSAENDLKDYPANLQVVKLKIVSTDERKRLEKIDLETSIDTEKQFAAGNFYDCKAGDSCRVAFDTKREEGQSTCQEDSGSTFISKSDDGEWYIVGIVSWGMGCGDGVYARVSYFRDWIEQTMNRFHKKEDLGKNSKEDTFRDSEY